MTLYELTTVYIPTAIAGLFIIAVIFLWSLKDSESYKKIAALTSLWVIAWIGPIWSDAWLLMWYEILIFVCMWLSLKSLSGVLLSLLTMMMAVNNGIFEITGGYDFDRWTVVSGIFVIQCVINIVVSYITHYQRGKENGGKYGHFQAMQGILLNLSFMGRWS